MPMDPNAPATKQLVAVCQEIWEEYIRTHTMEDVLALNQRVAEKRALRRRLFDCARPLTHDDAGVSEC